MVVDAVPIDLVDRELAMALIVDALRLPDPLAVASANLDHLHHFERDSFWTDRPPAVSIGDPSRGLRWLTLLDGVPLVRKAEALSGRPWPKLSGSDLIWPILEYAAKHGTRVGFLGGTAETHEQLRKTLRMRLPALQVAGTWAPARSEILDSRTSAGIAADIRSAEVEILIVGLGKPLQENWIARFGPDTGARVLLAFGAVVDFLAGRVSRAPRWMADHGFEWTWRLMLEPRRLSRRYLVHDPPELLRLMRREPTLQHEAAMAHPDRSVGRGAFVGHRRRATVAVVVVTYNSVSDLPGLIDDLRIAARDQSIRVVVVDNQSSDGTTDVVRSHTDITLVESGGNLGYAGGINAAMPFVEPCEAVLILNPDLSLAPGAVTRLMTSLRGDDRIGAVVPLILDADGAVYNSIRREPSLSRAVGDALLGRRLRKRPSLLSEIDYCPADYLEAHDVDWATGAALLIRTTVAHEVGPWNEEFFLYSEETDYFRRIRESGHLVRFEPSAVVQHRQGGSGTSPALARLMAVNRIRYVKRHHGAAYAVLFRGAVALAEALRSYDRERRRTLAAVLNRRKWRDLPHATSHG
ncbi:WecB/TagA/CpsF family glycosyltransferase [Rhodococcus aetherivorans]|uniref:WecB/TagA/CpsF family glycosyltransferase n=1 Tax=Rhodococcus aetherivorans TaxID=191292 RepID=A0AA46NU32_9NOCA|nr:MULTISPECIES: WecB/TagA/CpsF family glycosyltransferase [Rhodococcus]USC16797.1 WecB/TagA/CpsF family glycosyltransferase [Rhodococcus sp. 11-3]UYF93029.1 WecB/TagA/CpsF family glycosyltransferase [Rhodococcus aetherivorans]